MKYRAVINIDFTRQNKTAKNQYQKLMMALIMSGWHHVETSALIIEGELIEVLQAFELIAKQCRECGELSALTIHIQGSNNFEGKKLKAQKNHPNALNEIRAKLLPKT